MDNQLILQAIATFIFSFIVCALLTPITIAVAKRLNLVARPREDRWHKSPTALLGGAPIFIAFISGVTLIGLFSTPFHSDFPSASITSHISSYQFAILITSIFCMFLTGLIDDLFELSPQGKFLGQIAISAFIVAGGIRFLHGNPVVTIPLSIFWIVALINAFNILDNMDGLSAGIALIASISFLIFGYIKGSSPVLIYLSSAIGGASLGFLIYNLNPASIFMGDCGSLTIGTVMAIISIMSTWNGVYAINGGTGVTGPTNLFLMLLVPVAILIVPIFDTALVSFSRTRHGLSIFQGGKDHTSHRLVFLGLSEAKTVTLLMIWAAMISTLTILLSCYSNDGLIVTMSLMGIIVLFFGVFLTYNTQDVYPDGKQDNTGLRRWLSPLVAGILNKKQILQAVIDTLLLCLAYMASYLLRFEGRLSPENVLFIEKTLPVIILIKVVSFWAFGLYRGQWRFVSIWDMLQLFKAVAVSALVEMSLFLLLYRFEGLSRIVFINDAILTFLFISGVRFLLRLFKEYFDIERERSNTTPILIVGAGDGGELFLRELRKNQSHDYLPVGFIDDDIAKMGQSIHGVKVIGTREDMPRLVRRFGIKRVFVAIMSLSDKALGEFIAIGRECGVECIKVPSLLPPKREGDKEIHGSERKEDTNNTDAKVKRNNVIRLPLPLLLFLSSYCVLAGGIAS